MFCFSAKMAVEAPVTPKNKSLHWSMNSKLACQILTIQRALIDFKKKTGKHSRENQLW